LSRDVALRIRLATASDAPELSAIGSRVFWDAYGGTAPDDDIAAHVESYFSESAVSAEILRPDVTYFMATENKRCAGLVKVRDSDVPASVVAESAVEVQQLYVSMDFQRRGVGALLLDAVVAATRSRGIDGIWLSVWTDAEWATNFYFKYGFTSQAEIPFLLASTEFIDHLMWLPVGQK
jgi:ribosomal protein S18 acetylase RimI-like enzyme